MIKPNWENKESIEEYLEALAHKEAAEVADIEATHAFNAFEAGYFKSMLSCLLFKSKYRITVPQARAELIKRFNKQ